MRGALTLFEMTAAADVDGIQRFAQLSTDKAHRLALSRIWDTPRRLVMFVGLNPSTADAQVDDPTLRRCIGFAKSWGFDGLWMANLFSLRTPHPEILRAHLAPIHDATDRWLRAMRQQSELCIAAWGTDRMAEQRELHVLDLLGEVSVLGRCADGSPRHPLYMRGDTVPTPWVGPL